MHLSPSPSCRVSLSMLRPAIPERGDEATMSSSESTDAAASKESLQNLLYTPSWIIASVCTVFIVSSLIAERAIFFTGHALKQNRHTAPLAEAFEKIKEELMLVGFISLALTVGQRSITNICIPAHWSEIMLLCDKPPNEHKEIDTEASSAPQEGSTCGKGEVPFILLEGIHQLHILIFTLAVVHVVYSVLTMALGMYKVYQWRAWEGRANLAEALSAQGQLRLAKDVTFVRRHASAAWSRNSFLAYAAAFFQQFVHSMSETDYLTLRHGFIKKHMLPSNFNFHHYILETLEVDFKYVVGISPALWGYAIILTLLNIDGGRIYFWLSFLPLLLVLAVGTKLRRIITKMAVRVCDKHAVIEGMPDINPGDELFWFRSPRLILSIIHFILFQDALELTFHGWSMYAFPKGNCLFRQHGLLLGRLILGVLAQVTCGYIMLPLYALVSQMGSQMRTADTQLQTSCRLQDRWCQKGVVEGREGSWGKMQSVNENRMGPEFCGVVDIDTDERTESDAGGPVQVANTSLEHKRSYAERLSCCVHGTEYHTLAPAIVSKNIADT